VSLFELFLAVLVGVAAWQLNRRISGIPQGAVRVTVRILVNLVAVVVILILLSFAIFTSSD